jgi:hypothetical protein
MICLKILIPLKISPLFLPTFGVVYVVDKLALLNEL